MGKDNRWTLYSEKQLEELYELASDYKKFLNSAKTERECVKEITARIEKAGFRNLSSVVENGETLSPGDRVYAVWMKKTMALFTIGRQPFTDGLRILGAHIDSPRLDVKQVPLYEDTEFAYLDTHYYGGIKKYQWTTVPLAIHGVIAKEDGSVIDIKIGEDDDDPVFCITDLLIHLSKDQLTKKLGEAVEAENLDLLIGSRPFSNKKGDNTDGKGSRSTIEYISGQDNDPSMAGGARQTGDSTIVGIAGKDKYYSCGNGSGKAGKDLVKKNILAILKEKYGFEEEDFLSAELEIVPAGAARDMGIDRSMVASYGQDDRVCVFSSLDAFLRVKEPEMTTCCLFTDKEEIGSVGATGARSRFFENAVAEVLDRCGMFSELNLRRCLASSKMLSSDVSAAYDPLYASAYEKKNSAYFGHGIVYNKYTGARGKSGSNDANAEYFGWIRKVMDKAGVAFQTAELGKVDMGGGGTIAYISALYGMNVVDAGVAVLNMHAPLEISSKSDLYEARNAYIAFLKA